MSTTMMSPMVRCGRCKRENQLKNFLVYMGEVGESVISIDAGIILYSECECGHMIAIKYPANDLSELRADIFKMVVHAAKMDTSCKPN